MLNIFLNTYWGQYDDEDDDDNDVDADDDNEDNGDDNFVHGLDDSNTDDVDGGGDKRWHEMCRLLISSHYLKLQFMSFVFKCFMVLCSCFRVLESEYGIHCNMTLLFNFHQVCTDLVNVKQC